MSTFKVNDTRGDYHENFPAAATLAGGGYVIAWHSEGRGVCSHRFTATGASAGSDACITGDAALVPSIGPAVAGLPDGGYVLAYLRYEPSAQGVWVQRYDASGVAAGGAQRVDTATSGLPQHVSAAALPGGGYAVAWNWNDYPAVPNTDIFIRIFDANGEGGPVRLAAPSSASPFDRQVPSVAALSDGSLALIWADSDASLRGQYLGSDGVMRGAVFKVNSTFGVLASAPFVPRIASLATGGFVVTWTTQGESMAAMRVFDSNGNAGVEAAVNRPAPVDPPLVCRETQFGPEYCTHTQSNPVPVGLPDGTFVVAYVDSGTPTPQHLLAGRPGFGMYVRRFDPDGTALTDSMLAGSWAPRSAAPAGALGFVVTWDTSSNQLTSDVEAEQFTASAVR